MVMLMEITGAFDAFGTHDWPFTSLTHYPHAALPPQESFYIVPTGNVLLLFDFIKLPVHSNDWSMKEVLTVIIIHTFFPWTWVFAWCWVYWTVKDRHRVIPWVSVYLGQLICWILEGKHKLTMTADWNIKLHKYWEFNFFSIWHLFSWILLVN